MSRAVEIMYRCPYCGKEFPISVYESVTVKEDPDLRDRCVSGEVFKQSCPHCRRDFMVQNELLYSDPVHKFVIWLSERSIGETDLSAVTKPLLEGGYRLRRCRTVAEFTEKIQILEDGVDDAAVELAKYDCFIDFVNNKKGTPQDITGIVYQRTENEVMKINVQTHDKGTSFLIPLSMLKEEMEQAPDLFAVNDNEFPLINSDWIVSLFQEAQGEA